MSRQWKKIPLIEAQEHPLYGVKGWLLVFVIGSVLSALSGVGQINAVALKEGLTFSQLLSTELPIFSWVKFVLIVDAVTVASVLGLAFSKHPKFRSIISFTMLSAYPVVVITGMSMGIDFPPGMGTELGKGLIQWLMQCVVWVTYLQRSVRVRVTFENSIPVDELNVKVQPSATSTNRQTKAPMTTPTHLFNQSASHIPASPQQPIEFVQAAGSIAAEEEEHWAAAIAELEMGPRRPGVWAKAFAEAGGDDTKAQVAYLKARVQQLNEAANAVRSEQEAQQRAVEAREKTEATDKQTAVADAIYQFKMSPTLPISLIQFLVRNLDLDDSITKMVSLRDYPLLHVCAQNGMVEEVQALLHAGVKPDLPTWNGELAGSMTSNQMIKLLLSGTPESEMKLQSMKKHGITFESDQFHYLNVGYEKLEDALRLCR